MVRLHGPSLRYLFRKPEQSKTNQFYAQQCWILQQSQTLLSQHLLSFLALSFDFLHFIHGSTIGFSVKNELLITVKKKVNFFTNRSIDRRAQGKGSSIAGNWSRYNLCDIVTKASVAFVASTDPDVHFKCYILKR